ncbi:MAG: hypothetical protein RIB67_07690 [Miltoncostaeaceae bacterium]
MERSTDDHRRVHITVRGVVSERMAAGLGCEIVTRPACGFSRLSLREADPAAPGGILARLANLGITVVAVELARADGARPGDRPGGWG